MSVWTWMAGVAIAVALLWLNGRYWRSTWDAVPLLSDRNPKTVSKTAIVFADGAFNQSRPHTVGVINTWRKFGHVYLVEWPLKRFVMSAAVETIYDRLPEGYERIILIGASMGGIVCLNVALLEEQSFKYRWPGDKRRLGLIGCDVAQCAEELNFPLWLVKLAPHIHVGPLFNFLLSPIRRLMFRMMPFEQRSSGCDEVDLERHIKAMRQFKISAIVEQIAAIVENRPLKSSMFVDEMRGIVPGYLYSGKDEIIKGSSARASWEHLFPEGPELRVDAGMHVDFVEHAPEWSREFEWMLQDVTNRLGQI